MRNVIVDASPIIFIAKVNPLQFARKLWEKAHYRSERIREILYRHR